MAHVIGLEEDEKLIIEEGKKEEKSDFKAKQQRVLEEFKMKQDKFLYSHQSQLESVPKQTGEDIVCAVCGECLKAESYDVKPYGKIASVDMSMRLFHSRKLFLPELKGLHIYKVREEIDMSYIKKTGEGLNISSCHHYAHTACFDQLKPNQNANLLQLLILNIGSDAYISCPLCRCACSCLIPDVIPLKVTESVQKAAAFICQKILEEYSNKKAIGKFTALQFSKKILNIIQYNIQKVDILGIETYFKEIDYLRALICNAKIYWNAKNYEKEKGVLTNIGQTKDKQFFCDRNRVLIDNLFYELFKSSNDIISTLPASTLIIEKEFKLHFIAILLSIVLEQKVVQIENITVQTLIEAAKSNLAVIPQKSMKFIRKAVCAIISFCNFDKQSQEKLRSILLMEDEKQQWEELNSGILPIKPASVLENLFSGDTNEVKEMLENTINNINPVTLASMKLFTSNTPLKLFPLHHLYKRFLIIIKSLAKYVGSISKKKVFA